MKKVGKYPLERLVFYKYHADRVYWDAHWERVRIEDLLNSTFLTDLLLTYLPTTGKLLEAGCGLCQHVKMLKAMGYNIEGIDFSRLAIKKAKKFDQELSLIAGDILSLPYRDSSFTCCISLGVVEHFEKGPEEAIREMHRILVKDGILLISVPFFNLLRRVKGRLGLYMKLNENAGEFYQYGFTINEFKSILKNCGFTPFDIIPYDPIKGLKDELRLRQFASHFERRARKIKRTKQLKGEKCYDSTSQFILRILQSKILRKVAAHMMLFIAKKQNTLESNDNTVHQDVIA